MRPVGLGLRFSLAATAVALVIVAVGALVVAPVARIGVFAGGGAGLVLQVVVFWLFAVWFFPTRRLVAAGLGMGVRMAALLLMVLVASRTGLPLGPTLLTLVTVFVVTTMLEPILLQHETKRAS
jgi:hypothetical protein